MREFMDYVHGAFYEATGWSRDNSYAALNSTSDALLQFPTPRGLRLTLSALASPNFATSYQLGSVGVVDGSISYLFSSVPLRVLLTPQSEKVALPTLLRSYRPLTPLTSAAAAPQTVLPSLPTAADSHASLLYGRLYLPQSQLEALVVKRLSRHLQVQFSAVSGQHLRNGGTTLGLAQYDVGTYALEGLASSDGGLLGLRGIYNFGGDAAEPMATKTTTAPDAATSGGGEQLLPTMTAATKTTTTTPPPNGEKERIYGRFSTGAEIYYGTLNKSGGISLAGRFATLPSHKGTPLAATLTLNPLMGSVGASYAVVAGRHCTLATRMDFNIFSYESVWSIGMELWRKPSTRPLSPPPSLSLVADGLSVSPPPETRRPHAGRSFQAKMEWRLDRPLEDGGRDLLTAELAGENRNALASSATASGELQARAQSQEPERLDGAAEHQPGWQAHDEYTGVLKARFDQNLRIGLLWEGRVKSLLFSLGSDIDLRHMDKPFRTLGLEIQFSS
ncbi:hypothetical protein CCM_02599 [Cordyceps militaris CM01]|uniref:Mitochondrial distribution and morphology protein 10 n=1 Tax=Cordyceps militaris (strain CM01) TaxID=983644 RepID=G3JAL2_CORMM|nr:uncharacterized protein CCM_02599 [Cordyceps militaris CM01]EGX94328.1 hypothetical protein CCM_02599 [Cordyceps militaris CM01]